MQGAPFAGYHWDPEVLLTEVVPYINLTNPTLHDPSKGGGAVLLLYTCLVLHTLLCS